VLEHARGRGVYRALVSARLAFLESLLAAGYFGAAVAFVRLTRRA
jgi:hypothetical protein